VIVECLLVGHSLPKWAIHPMSAFPPLATKLPTSLEVRFVRQKRKSGGLTRSPRRRERALFPGR
jgi:hypothetical protein